MLDVWLCLRPERPSPPVSRPRRGHRRPPLTAKCRPRRVEQRRRQTTRRGGCHGSATHPYIDPSARSVPVHETSPLLAGDPVTLTPLEARLAPPLRGIPVPPAWTAGGRGARQSVCRRQPPSAEPRRLRRNRQLSDALRRPAAASGASVTTGDGCVTPVTPEVGCVTGVAPAGVRRARRRWRGRAAC